MQKKKYANTIYKLFRLKPYLPYESKAYWGWINCVKTF